MSKQTVETVRSTPQQPKTPRLAYHKPTVYHLGSLEQVQAGASGNQIDGPDGLYYYY